MSKVRVVMSCSIVAVWVIGYLMAYFVDRSLAELAKSATPLATAALTALLGTEAINIVKGSREKSPS